MLLDDDIVKAKSTIFFGALPDPAFEAVTNGAVVIDVGAGEPIFHQGEYAGSVFAVLDGLVKLSVESREGKDIVLEIFQASTSFAEALAFKEEPYPVTATALVQSRILCVPRHIVRSVLHSSPNTIDAIMAATFAHLHNLVRQVEELKSSSGQQRVVRYILALAEASPNAGDIEIPFDKQVLASLLGIKPETLSRIFRRLETHGVVVNGSKISMTSRAKLVNLIEAA